MVAFAICLVSSIQATSLYLIPGVVLACTQPPPRYTTFHTARSGDRISCIPDEAEGSTKRVLAVSLSSLVMFEEQMKLSEILRGAGCGKREARQQVKNHRRPLLVGFKRVQGCS